MSLSLFINPQTLINLSDKTQIAVWPTFNMKNNDIFSLVVGMDSCELTSNMALKVLSEDVYNAVRASFVQFFPGCFAAIMLRKGWAEGRAPCCLPLELWQSLVISSLTCTVVHCLQAVCCSGYMIAGLVMRAYLIFRKTPFTQKRTFTDGTRTWVMKICPILVLHQSVSSALCSLIHSLYLFQVIA